MKPIYVSKFNLSTEDISRMIDLWIFSERDRAVLKRRLIDNIGFEKLSEEFDLSVRRTKTIVYKGLDVLISHM